MPKNSKAKKSTVITKLKYGCSLLQFADHALPSFVRFWKILHLALLFLLEQTNCLYRMHHEDREKLFL